MTIDSTALNASICLLADPSVWAARYSNRPTVAAPIFAEFNKDGLVRLLDITGGIDPDWSRPSDLEITREDVITLDPDVWTRAQAVLAEHGSATALSALAHYMSDLSENWEQFSAELQADRFTASAWFERDRQNLVLTDSLANADVVTLWDESVSDAIESGYLNAPRKPRANDEDWVPCLIAYAESQGLLPLQTLSLKPPGPALHHPTPQG